MIPFLLVMTSFDPSSWTAILDFTFFKKSQEIKEIKTNSSQNAYEMYKFVNFCYFMKKTGKNYRIMSKKLIFGQMYMEFGGCHGNVKNDG